MTGSDVYIYTYFTQKNYSNLFAPNIDVHIYIYIHIYIYMHIYICIYIYTCSCTYTHAHVIIYQYQYIYVYIYINTHIYIYTINKYIYIHSKHIFKFTSRFCTIVLLTISACPFAVLPFLVAILTLSSHWPQDSLSYMLHTQFSVGFEPFNYHQFPHVAH